MLANMLIIKVTEGKGTIKKLYLILQTLKKPKKA